MITLRALSARCGLSTASLAAAAFVSACGGGGGSSVSERPLAIVLGGVAATGAPFAEAEVKVFDRRGADVCSARTDAQGHYRCELASAATAPFAIVARLGEQALYSTAATTVSATVNVTPLTTLIVARLTPSGDPARLVEALAADPTLVDAPKLQAKVDEVQALIAPLLGAVGDSVNPISGAFAADGSGHDKVLDSLQVSIRPEAEASNIELTVKTRPASDADRPVSLSFKSSDVAPAPLAAPIRSDALVDSGIAGLMMGFLGRATACYAEPLSQRIAGVPEGATQASGDGAAVAAPSCRGLFLDSAPSLYKDNGALVGPGGSFAGLFRSSSTGVKFDHPVFEYQLANGDVYVTFRTTTVTGVVGWSALTMRKQDGLLRAVGNQYAYDASVRAYASDREFPMQPRFSWIGSGYAPSIRNKLDPQTRLPIFKEAYVTAPDGRRSTYRPLSGRSAMGIVAEDGRQRVNVVQFLAAEFQNLSTAGTPAAKDGRGGAYFVDPQLDDTALLALPDHGVWTIEWVHVDPALDNVTQRYRTVSRAPTVAELRQMKFAQLDAAFKSELTARSDVASAGAVIFGAPSAEQPSVFSFATASGADGWTVPDGALAPVSISTYGASPNGAGFNDTTAVLAAERKGTVNCSSQSATDFHCDDTTGTTQYAQGSRVDAFDLWTRNGRQLEIQKQVNLYRLAE